MKSTARSLGVRLLAYSADPPPPSRVAVLDACALVGLNVDDCTEDYDLSRTGKLYEVLIHASRALGKDSELCTVADVIAWLDEAPQHD